MAFLLTTENFNNIITNVMKNIKSFQCQPMIVAGVTNYCVLARGNEMALMVLS